MTWEITKTPSGGGAYLEVGRAGVPGYVKVDGLTSLQAEALHDALSRVEENAKWSALAAVREALGLKR